MLLILALIGALLGVGLLKAFLERCTNWSEAIQWAVTAVTVALFTVISYVYTAYPTWPRHLHEWQREALLAHCPTVKPIAGRIAYFLGYPLGDLEAEDFARELMGVLADRGCHLSIAYGDDPFPKDIVVNEKKVIVPPNNNVLLRVAGMQLWTENPHNPPTAAKQLAAALDSAGLRPSWKPDIRLSGIAAEGDYRFPVNGPDCILIIGTKPPWSLHDWWFTETRHFAWYEEWLRTHLTIL
jgi:hypothetical protein